MPFSSHAILGGPDFLSVTAHLDFNCTYMFPLWSFPDHGLSFPHWKYAMKMFGYIVLYQLLMSVNVFQITREFTLHANFQHTYTRVG